MTEERESSPGTAATPAEPASEGRRRPPRPTAAETAYPPPLLDEEEELLEARRNVPPPERGRPVECKIGFGLSGGGIRSATFCLGLFQGLAAKGGLIRKIDYLSTVSGGGYFGSFLGRLFTRDYVRTPDDVESILDRDRTVDGSVGGVIGNLRENGRYLSPNGSGDLLLGGAVLLRNWVSLQVVLWTFLLTAFLLLQSVRVAVEVGAHQLGRGEILSRPGWVAWDVWWSPSLLLPAAVFVLSVFPLGWAYWLVERVGRRLAQAGDGTPEDGRGEGVRPFLPVVLVVLLGLGLLGRCLWRAGGSWAGVDFGDASFWVPAALLVAALLTPVWWWASLVSERRSFRRAMREKRDAGQRQEAARPGDGTGAAEEESPRTEREIFEDAAVRNLLSRRLKTSLVVTGLLLAFALVDSLGQTLYLVGMHPHETVLGWIGGIFAGLTALSGFARRLAVQLGGSPVGGRVRVPVDVVATVGGLLVVLFLLVTLDAGSHAVAWGRTVPVDVLAGLFHEESGGVVTAEARLPRARSLDLQLTVPARPEEESPPEGIQPGVRDSWKWLPAPLVGFLFTGLLSWAFGRIWPFVNRSSHHPLYSARLTRAYLGASNPRRLGPRPKSVTRSIPGDDVDLATYWPPPGQNAAPIHLINVTVNETVDGRSQVEQKDRKGMGLALGPCGLSVGVRHHLVAPFGVELDPDRAKVYPPRDGTFRVFEYPGTDFRGEVLPLGAWVGISGAAFSTGLGARTSLGLSLLLGLANVRLGYWWDSGVDPRDREAVADGNGSPEPGRGKGAPAKGRSTRLALHPFAVQDFLKDELLARFPGTARRHWYLSDGGHFENMGGYELIRRRLPFIVIVDAEADPDYTYGGLANLVRKARLDFGAEIDFLSPEEIDRELPPEVACHVGSLEQLRRGLWKRGAEGDWQDGKRRRPVADLEAADRTGRCLVHAALARVVYGDDGTESRLLYIKPSLFGDEPEDVLDYHRRNPDFPQQTTADQFFDEAQWESYRRLGRHIAEKIFRTETEGTADLARARGPRKINTDGDPEPEEERKRRVATLWHPGRLECPPAAVSNPTAAESARGPGPAGA